MTGREHRVTIITYLPSGPLFSGTREKLRTRITCLKASGPFIGSNESTGTQIRNFLSIRSYRRRKSGRVRHHRLTLIAIAVRSIENFFKRASALSRFTSR